MKCVLPVLTLFFMFTSPVAAERPADEDQLRRITAAKVFLRNVEQRSAGEIFRAFKATSYPEGNLQIFEAVAKAYDEIVREQNVVEAEKGKWLYSMVQLNMAYLQFGGPGSSKDTGLNRLIRRKLKEHLAPGLLSDARLIHRLE